MIIDIEERYAGEEEADDPEAEWAMSVDEVTPPRGVFLIAYLDGQPVGCGALRSLPPTGARVAEIKRMYTAPAARRRGVSRAASPWTSDRSSGHPAIACRHLMGGRRPVRPWCAAGRPRSVVVLWR
jgi:GNAT superfamily N-acetyltransferase